MKFMVFGVVALFGVALAEVDLLATEVPYGRVVNNHQGPYSLKVFLSENEDQQEEQEGLLDDHVLLENTFGRSLIADMIMNTLEDLRDVVINGNESVPPLDPLVIDTMGPFELDITGIRVRAAVNNLRAEGLRWYVVDYVTFNALRLTLGLQVTLPRLTVTGAYEVETRIALLFTHKAGGNFRVFLNRFEVAVDVRLGTSILGGHLFLRQLDIRLDIADTFIQIDGMTGSPIINSFISSYVQTLTQDIIQNHLDEISQLISEVLFDAINEVLKDFTLNDIMGFKKTEILK